MTVKRYLVFVVSFEGNVVSSMQIDCNDEADAIERAKNIVADGLVELWTGPRRIARFNSAPVSSEMEPVFTSALSDSLLQGP